MTALLLAVLSASLLGSLHCAGMCGAFVVMAVSDTGSGLAASRPWRLHAAYHLGRLATYVAFGTAAGALGATLDLGGSLVGVQRAATAAAAAMLLVFGTLMLLRLAGVRTGTWRGPGWMARWAQAGHRAAWELEPVKRAAVIGLLTSLLPCGWLYAFVITAAGTGSPALGAAVMVVFWAGTLPVMASLGIGARRLAGPLGRWAPGLTASAMIAVAALTLVHRGGLVGMRLPTAAEVSAGAASVGAVPNPNEVPPCCRDD
ncbi:MAG: sulfite exporter TauE/SafE family protein [Phycisphaerae bacterium]|nr:sulfite exporter TauE/SafE family protein [Phycisphaerae bacterium]